MPEDFEGDEPDWVEDEKANFDMVLDKNTDGKLDEKEVREWLVPDTETTNQVEMRHLFMSADTNRVSERFDIMHVVLFQLRARYSVNNS